MMAKELEVPSEFIYYPFYTTNNVIGVEDQNAPFYYDIMYALYKSEDHPWETQKDYLPKIFNEFKEVNSKLSQLYANRDRKNAKPIMIIMLAKWIDSLFWTNNVPVTSLQKWKSHVEGFKYKPVNIKERLEFILKEPDHFHSYNQIKSLYDEMEKLYYKSVIGKN